MKLKIQGLRLFKLVFESDPGWILDFPNRTLSAFFDEELNIDIDDERYKEEKTSKAKRVRCLLKQVDQRQPCGFLMLCGGIKWRPCLSRPNKAAMTGLH